NTALSPLAISMKARPLGRLSMEARNDAITCGSRVSGLGRRGPIRARTEAMAMSVARTKVSPLINAESIVPMASAPYASAIRTRSINFRVSSRRSSGVPALTVIPNAIFIDGLLYSDPQEHQVGSERRSVSIFASDPLFIRQKTQCYAHD